MNTLSYILIKNESPVHLGDQQKIKEKRVETGSPCIKKSCEWSVTALQGYHSCFVEISNTKWMFYKSKNSICEKFLISFLTTGKYWKVSQ